MSVVETRLSELGLAVPEIVTPLASYTPAVRSGEHVYSSRQLPVHDGVLVRNGKVGSHVTFDEAADLARICVLNALAALKEVIGNLDRVARVVRIIGSVASGPHFADAPAIINGADELLRATFDAVEVDATTVMSVDELPRDAPVEVELVVALSR